MSLVLGHHQPGRRAGLSRDYNGARLLQTINASASQNRNTMPPRAVTKGGTAAGKQKAVVKNEPEEEEDYLRPPDSDSEEPYDAGDIQGTDFRSASEKAEEQKQKDILAIAGRKKGIALVGGNAASSTRSRRRKISPASSPPNSSAKRKSQDEVKPLGAGMVDPFGRVNIKKQKTLRASYGNRAINAAPKFDSGSQTTGSFDQTYTNT
jgi:hypothetical protein